MRGAALRAGQVIGGIGLMLLDDAMSLAPLVSRFNQLKRECAEARQHLDAARRAKYTLSGIVGNSDSCVAPGAFTGADRNVRELQNVLERAPPPNSASRAPRSMRRLRCWALADRRPPRRGFTVRRGGHLVRPVRSPNTQWRGFRARPQHGPLLAVSWSFALREACINLSGDLSWIF